MNYNNYDNQYSTTSYGAQGGAGGGGFMSGGNSSQTNTGGGGRDYNKESLRPVTIKQLLDAVPGTGDGEFKVDGSEITSVYIVAQIRNISMQTTNITYKLDDGTGMIEAKQWVDADAAMNGDGNGNEPGAELAENDYVKIFGKLKSFSNKKHLGATVIRKVTDFNEISHHLLDATRVHLFFTRGPPGQARAGAANGDGRHGAQPSGGQQMPSGMSLTARKVLQTLHEQPQSNEGLHLEAIASMLNLPSAEVESAGNQLLDAGHIYTTVDDQTWALLVV